jgi:hypothetical protein
MGSRSQQILGNILRECAHITVGVWQSACQAGRHHAAVVHPGGPEGVEDGWGGVVSEPPLQAVLLAAYAKYPKKTLRLVEATSGSARAAWFMYLHSN